MEPWRRIEPTIVTKVDYHNVVVKTFELPDGALATRAVFHKDNARSAGVIAVTKEKKVVVARQFRPGPEAVLDEIPGGGVGEDEDPEAAALRELKEETGYTPEEVQFLGTSVRDAYVAGTWYYYLATGCEKTDEPQSDEDEFVEVRLVSIDEFLANAKKGTMTDPFAVLAAYDQLIKINKEGK